MSDEKLSKGQNEAQERELERSIRSKARRRVAMKIGFMWHVAIFFMVMLALAAINHIYTPDVLWVLWPLGGWGAALLLHGFATFATTGMSESMVKTEIEHEKKRRAKKKK